MIFWPQPMIGVLSVFLLKVWPETNRVKNRQAVVPSKGVNMAVKRDDPSGTSSPGHSSNATPAITRVSRDVTLLSKRSGIITQITKLHFADTVTVESSEHMDFDLCLLVIPKAWLGSVKHRHTHNRRNDI